MSVRTRIKDILRKLLLQAGFDLVPKNLIQDWQIERHLQGSSKPTLPANAHQSLRPDHPVLLDLHRRYQALDLPECEDPVWKEGIIRAEDILYFRGHNAYLYQEGSCNRNLIGYLLAYYYIKSIDSYKLLDTLVEDTAFGVVTYQVDGKLISRDLLDSILEIYFLEDMIGFMSRENLSIIDIGAGYGRLAYRMLTANPTIQSYICTDGIAESSFISDYYLGYRGIKDRASMIPLDRIRDELLPGSIDLALNIHSFSECALPMIDWWISLLAEKEVPYLMIVPNSIRQLNTNQKEDFQPLVESYGYRYITHQPKYLDPMVQKYALNPALYYFFELSS